VNSAAHRRSPTQQNASSPPAFSLDVINACRYQINRMRSPDCLRASTISGGKPALRPRKADTLRPNMKSIQTDTPTKRRVSFKVTYGILLACVAMWIAYYLLEPEYRVGAVTLAVLGLTGLIYVAIVRQPRSPQRAVLDDADPGNHEADSMISVIICSIDSTKYELVCANLKERFGDSPHEIIGIHDAKSMCEGYNRGVEKSQGDILIFCHDDIEIISPRFPSLVREHLKAFDVIGCAGTTQLKDCRWMSSGDPYIHGVVAYPVANAWPGALFDVSMWGGIELTRIGGIQAMDGFFLAANRYVVDSVRFDEKTFDGFHGYDADFTYAAFLCGYELAVCKDVLIAHKSGGDFEGSHKIYAEKFYEKYKDRLPEKMEDGICEQNLYQNVDRTQMLKAWF
jgi:hypothetical protein